MTNFEAAWNNTKSGGPLDWLKVFLIAAMWFGMGGFIGSVLFGPEASLVSLIVAGFSGAAIGILLKAL